MQRSVPELVRLARAAGWVVAPLRPPRNLALGRLLDRRRVRAVRDLLMTEMEQRRSGALS